MVKKITTPEISDAANQGICGEPKIIKKSVRQLVN